MALGFKVADGYVEVHAKYDKGELRKAAQDAADDHDKAFNKEHDQNTKRDATHFNDAIGGGQASRQRAGELAGRDHAKGVARGADRQADKDRNTFRRIGRKITEHMFGKDNAAAGATAFFKRFAEAITFGQADFSSPKIMGPLTAKFAAMGTALGVTLAAALIVQIAAALTSVAPLLLGGLVAAIPMISLIKTGVKKEDGKWVFQANAMGEALKKLSKAWKDFKATVSAPFQAPLLEILKSAGDSLGRLAKPWAALVKSISPGIVALFKGIFGAIEAFVTAVAPAMPGVNEGLKTWGEELPKIGKSLGDFFVKLMKDPKKVHDAVVTVSNIVQDTLTFAGGLISVLTTLSSWYHRFADAIDRFEKKNDEFMKALTKPFNGVEAWLKPFMTKFLAFFKALPGKVAAALQGFGKAVTDKIQAGQAKITAKAKAIVTAVVNFFKTLPSKAGSAVSKLWASMKRHFDQVVSSGKARAKQAVDGVVNFFKSLPGKARSAVSRLWSSMQGAFTSAVSNAKAKGKALVDGFINALKAIVAKAKAQVNAAKNAIKAAFSGAGSWLVSAGKAIISGLAAGIRSGVSIAVNAAVTAAKAALGAAKRALGIASPSKVFAEEVGKPIAQGIGIGMSKQIPFEMKGLSGLLPRAMGSSGSSASYQTTSSFSPTINIHVAAGLDPVNAAARRALTKDLFLALEQYRKDYVK